MGPRRSRHMRPPWTEREHPANAYAALMKRAGHLSETVVLHQLAQIQASAGGSA